MDPPSRSISLSAIGRRRFNDASVLFRRLASPTAESLFLDAYATAMAGDAASAAAILTENQTVYPGVPWTWLAKRFSLETTEPIDRGREASGR